MRLPSHEDDKRAVVTSIGAFLNLGGIWTIPVISPRQVTSERSIRRRGRARRAGPRVRRGPRRPEAGRHGRRRRGPVRRGGAGWRRSRDVLGGLGLDAGLLEEAEVTGPVDEAKLPGSEGDVVAVGQATRHAAPIRQGVARVATIAVKVHLHIRAPPPSASPGNTRGPRWRVTRSPALPQTRNAGGTSLGSAARSGCGRRAWAGVDDSDEVRTRRDAGKRVGGIVVFLVPLFVKNAAAERRSSAPAEKPITPIRWGSMPHSLA